jgi:hypothetical protein
MWMPASDPWDACIALEFIGFFGLHRTRTCQQMTRITNRAIDRLLHQSVTGCNLTGAGLWRQAWYVSSVLAKVVHAHCCIFVLLLYNHVRLADKSWLKVLMAYLLWEKNAAPWLIIRLISSSEQGACLMYGWNKQDAVWCRLMDMATCRHR